MKLKRKQKRSLLMLIIFCVAISSFIVIDYEYMQGIKTWSVDRVASAIFLWIYVGFIGGVIATVAKGISYLLLPKIQKASNK